MDNPSAIAVLSLRECTPVLDGAESSHPVWAFPCGLTLSDAVAFIPTPYRIKQLMYDVHRAHHDTGHPKRMWQILATEDTGDFRVTLSFTCDCP